MTEIQRKSEYPELVTESTGAWNRIAEWWDDQIGDGNSTQDVLEPATERLLGIGAGEEVLDIACGAGRMARRLAKLGAHVTAFDHAENFVQRARTRTNAVELAGNVEYSVMNAADSSALLSLGEGRFDAAVCTMALMDMATIEPLAACLPRLLKPSGRFVFSVTHPSFNSGRTRIVAERDDWSGTLETRFGVAAFDYLEPSVQRGVGIGGQPEPQHYFHRPLSLLLGTFIEQGFVLDALEEHAVGPDRPSANPVS